MITEYRENKACTISFDITEDIAGPVFIYYELSNFYQNHATWVAGCTCLLMLLFLISALRGRLTSVCLANVKWSGKTTTKNVHGARAACRPSPWRAHVWSSDDAIRHSGWLFFFFFRADKGVLLVSRESDVCVLVVPRVLACVCVMLWSLI